MTDEVLDKAINIKKEMESVENTLYQLGKKPNCKNVMLRIAHNSAKGKYEAYVFESNSVHGLDIYFDDGLVQCLREYYSKKLVQLEDEYKNL